MADEKHEGTNAENASVEESEMLEGRNVEDEMEELEMQVAEEQEEQEEDCGEDEEGAGAHRPAILVCGAAGSGKTSLISAVCPDGVVPDDDVEGELAEAGLVVYETDVADFVDFRGIELGETVEGYLEAVDEALAEQLPGARIPRYDCAWLCVDGERGKVQRADLEIAKRLGGRAIAVVTKSDELEQDAVERMIGKLSQALPPERVVTVSPANGLGLRHLMDTTCESLADGMPADAAADFAEAWDEYFEERAGDEETSVAGQKADEYIYWAAGRAFAIALVPLPLADIGPLIANEAYMIYRIGACHGYAVDQTVIAGFLGCLGASVVGKVAASFLPFLKAPIAAAVTYGVGQAANAYFASGMSLGENELKELFENGKEKAKNIDWKNASKQFGI